MTFSLFSSTSLEHYIFSPFSYSVLVFLKEEDSAYNFEQYKATYFMQKDIKTQVCAILLLYFSKALLTPALALRME